MTDTVEEFEFKNELSLQDCMLDLSKEFGKVAVLSKHGVDFRTHNENHTNLTQEGRDNTIQTYDGRSQEDGFETHYNDL